MMLGLQGNASSAKVYRCVACSATFHGLASLLVHQATHASALSKVPTTPTRPIFSPNETVHASMDSSSEHRIPPTILPESPSPSFYICDCGEEFQDFSLMLEHKRSHVSEIQHLQPLESNILPSSGTVGDPVFPTQCVPFIPTVAQPGLALGCPSTSRSPSVKQPALVENRADVILGGGNAIVTTPQCQSASPQEDSGKIVDNISATAEEITETLGDMHFQDNVKSVSSSEKDERLPKNNNIMKVVASAYMKRFTRSASVNIDHKAVTPKQEVVPVEIMPGAKTKVSTNNDLSISQLRRLLKKPGIETKAPSISRILESSKKKIVSLTKTFSPVVVLETRQKLMYPMGNGTQGTYQCGRCRRVFQNLDSLTEHHFLHKKERIKCCRRCKQLIIGRLPLPDNHVCPQLGDKNIRPPSSLPKKFKFAQKTVPIQRLNTKKVFFCPLCKHSYARRWNLKMHKCQGSAFSQKAIPPIQKILVLGSNSLVKSDTEDKAESHSVKSIAVGTVTGRIKAEVTSYNTAQSTVSKLAWTPPSKRFLPFCSKPSVMEEHTYASECENSLEQEENRWDKVSGDSDDGNEGRWTMPLDDEIEVNKSTEKAEDSEANTSVSVEHSETTPANLQSFVSEGVKRYPCNRCQKTYSRASTLSRHLRLCGFRPRGLGTAAQSGSRGAIPLNMDNMTPMFPCFFCGKKFNRKDNMMTHSRKCQLKRAMPNMTSQQSLSGMGTDCQTKEDDGGSWGIMSLPSVLPRRVTCECGVGFTSPRLLLEHLQKHAQESYTCPTCGETVSSWADYEVHLQIHMQPHHQLLKGLQPQRSQPLLLRFQKQYSQQQPTPSVRQPPQKQPSPEQLPNPTKKKQRIVCTRCGNTFSTRCSLRRHISWNRCKGTRVANLPANQPKTYHCSHCNSDFPNTISLIFHQRSGACKPAIKPVRCPICLRWFSTVDSLQKHLLAHKQSDSLAVMSVMVNTQTLNN